jgi:hypothetical protein
MALTIDDPIGRAVYDYHFNSISQPIIVHCDDFDDDTIETSYLFRPYKRMPVLEKKALKLCRGSILDVGACAGAHAVYLKNKGFDVTAIDQSAFCCNVLKNRDITKVIQENIFSFNGQTFDTILLLMNGTGIAGTLSGLDVLFHQLRSLLNSGGQILIDSSDLIYLYEQKDGSGSINLNTERYYGELIFQTEYRNWISETFSWLYVDEESLEQSVIKNNLKIERIIRGRHFDYLAQITL